MKGKFKKFAAAFAAVSIIMGSVPNLAFAAGYTAIGGPGVADSITPKSGEDGYETSSQVVFKKYLAMENDAAVPAAEFSYVISVPTERLAATTTELAVFPGKILDTYPKIANVTYLPSDTTTAGLPVPNGTETGITANYKYCEKNVAINFGTATNFFDEPGIYRYYIQETGVNMGVENDKMFTVANSGDDATATSDSIIANGTATNGWRTLDIYVSDVDGELKIAQTMLRQGKIETRPAIGASLGDKSQGYINVYDTSDLTVGKTVVGNQGSKNKYFKFTIRIANLNENTKITVDNDHVDKNTSGSTAPNVATKSDYTGAEINEKNTITEQTATDADIDGREGKKQTTFIYYLANGEYVTLKGIPKGAYYYVTEEAEDYTPNPASDTNHITLNSTITLEDEVTGQISNLDVYTGFQNSLDGTIPTGIIMSIAPAAIVGIGVLAAIIALVIAGKKRAIEED